MIRARVAFALVLVAPLAACGGSESEGGSPAAGPPPSSPARSDPALPGDRRLLGRDEVSETLRIPLPPGEITACIRTEYTLGVQMKSPSALEEIVAWFGGHLDPLVPGVFKPLAAHRKERWATRELQHKTQRMAQYEYADGVHSLNVVVIRDEREDHRVVHFDRVLTKPPQIGIPPKPR